jgi:hypothetical protein
MRFTLCVSLYAFVLVVSHGFFTPDVIPSQVTPQAVAQAYLEQAPVLPVKGDLLKFITLLSSLLGTLHVPKR